MARVGKYRRNAVDERPIKPFIVKVEPSEDPITIKQEKEEKEAPIFSDWKVKPEVFIKPEKEENEPIVKVRN